MKVAPRGLGKYSGTPATGTATPLERPMQLTLSSWIVGLVAAVIGCAAAPPELARLTPLGQAARARFDHNHHLWSEVLGRHVRGERFDYRALKAEPAELDAYLARLQAVTAEEYAGWKREQRFAFWINAYNAYTVRRVVEGYPVDSIKDLGSLARSVWDQRFIPLAHLAPDLGREQLSLNDVEHEILRPIFQDPRINAAVNCASKSCPRLMDSAYTAGVLEQQLDQVTRRWLAEPGRNRFDATTRTAHLSRIFDWYGADFGEAKAARLAWIARHAPAEHRDWLARTDPEGVQIRFLEYDWVLNEVPREGAAR